MFVINPQSRLPKQQQLVGLYKISNLQLDQNFSDKFFLSEYPTKESFNNLMLTVLKNILP